MEKNKNIGLNDKNKKFILLIIIVILLFLGPIEPYGMVFRILYLIIIPLIVWFIFSRYGKKWKINVIVNNKLTSVLYGVIIGLLLGNTYASYTSKYHMECTQVVQTRDGQECVGDYVKVKGRDKEGVIMSLIFAGFTLYLALKKENEEID